MWLPPYEVGAGVGSDLASLIARALNGLVALAVMMFFATKNAGSAQAA